MKRILILMLAFSLCIGLTACYDPSSKLYDKFVPGGEENKAEQSDEFTILGDWLRVSDGMKIVFKEDVCIINGEEAKYGYDEKLGIVSHYDVVTRNYNLEKEDGIYKLVIDEDNIFVPAADYEKAHAEYLETYVPEITEGKTELTVGATYEAANGLSFSIENAELIIEGDRAYLSFEVAFDGDFNITQSNYVSPTHESLFSVVEESRSESSAKYVYPVDMPTEDLTQDAKGFGMLALDIGGTDYYIAASEFVDLPEEEDTKTEPADEGAESTDLTITVINDSMQPTLKAGDVIRCEKVDASELAIGDIISYWTVIDGERVADTKRIVNIYDGGGYFIFETKGDADAEPNPLTVHESEIIGRLDRVIG